MENRYAIHRTSIGVPLFAMQLASIEARQLSRFHRCLPPGSLIWTKQGSMTFRTCFMAAGLCTVPYGIQHEAKKIRGHLRLDKVYRRNHVAALLASMSLGSRPRNTAACRDQLGVHYWLADEHTRRWYCHDMEMRRISCGVALLSLAEALKVCYATSCT